MSLTSLDDLTACQKDELVASLSCLAIGDGELTAEKLQAVATASGNSLSDGIAALFANVVSKSKDGIKTFTPPPGGGGGGGGSGGGGGGGGGAEAAAEEEPEEEEEDAPAAGGGLFGDDGDGGDY